MFAKIALLSAIAAACCMSLPDEVFGRGFGGGGGSRGGGGGSRGGGGGGGYSRSGSSSGSYNRNVSSSGSYNRGGGGYGSVRYSGWSGSSSASVNRNTSVNYNRSVNAGSTRYASNSGIRTGQNGGSAGWVKGPAGGGAAAVQGPRGNTAAAVRGPGGAGAAGYRTAYGSAGAVVRGPAGNTAAGFRGPAGGVVAGARGANGRYVAAAALPSSYRAVAWRGSNYYYSGNSFYRPYWYGGSVCYWPVSPPIGWFMSTLPSGYIQYTDASSNTYYYSGDSCYQAATQDGQQGYVVVDSPTGNQASQGPPSTQFAATAPDPFQTLKKMCDYISGQDSITMTVSTATDEVADSGQDVQLECRRTIYFQRPDKFAVDCRDDDTQRRTVYDGTQVTTVDLTKNLYGTLPMKGTVDVALGQLAKKYGMAFPLGDLLSKDAYAALSANIQAGQYVGEETVGGKQCDHIAFRQSDIDWEIWIQQGDTPIPRKLSVIQTGVEGQPRHTSMVSKWDTGPIAAATFTVQLPADAKKIDVLPIGAVPRRRYGRPDKSVAQVV